MTLLALPATISDISSIFDVYFSAFKNEVILPIIFPAGITPEFRKAHTEHTLQWWHTATQQFFFKCIDTETDEVVGMAIWDVFWKERSEDERRVPGVDWLSGKEKERAEAFLRPFWERKEKLLGGNKFVCK